jgi:Leucine-rich repeat (LRR) protein
MDQSLYKFENLQVLNLSNNSICRVENMPPQLRELNLTNNMIDEIETLRIPHQSLIHLGLSYNRVRNVTLAVIAKNFPNLFCLDVSFNELSDFKSSLTWFEELNKLKMLYVQGNPIALSDQAREILK